MQGLRASATTLNDLANGIAAIGVGADQRSVGRSTRRLIDVSRRRRIARSRIPSCATRPTRIAGEALRNAVKHAQARRVTVTIHYERAAAAPVRFATTGRASTRRR